MGSLSNKYGSTATGSLSKKYSNTSSGSLASKYLGATTAATNNAQTITEWTGIQNPTTYWQDSLAQIKRSPWQNIKNAASSAIDSLVGTIKNAVSTTKEAFTGENETAAKKTADVLYALGADAAVLFTPMTMIFSAAEQVPGFKQAADVVNGVFSVVGKIGAFPAEKFVEVLPIDQESKDVLKPAFGQIGSLAAQILLGGKVAKMISKGKKITPELINKEVETVKKETVIAQQEALKRQQVQPAQSLDQEAIQTPNVPQTNIAPTLAVNTTSLGLIKKAVKEDILKEGEIQTHEIAKMDKWVEDATDLFSKNPNEAMKIAMAEKQAPEGIPASTIFKVIEKYAIENKDIPTILKLNKSKLGVELGRAVKGFDVFNELSPVERIKEIERAITERAKKTGIKPEPLIKEAKVARDVVPKETLVKKLDKFIEENICP